MASDPTPRDLSDAEWLETLRNGPKANSAKLLGVEVLEVDQASNRIIATCVGPQAFMNPNGTLQGGCLTAMLDEVSAIAVFVTSGGTVGIASAEIKTSYLRPVKPGEPIKAIGEVIKMGRSLVFVEGTLYNEDGDMIARMSSNGLPTPLNFEASE